MLQTRCPRGLQKLWKGRTDKKYREDKKEKEEWKEKEKQRHKKYSQEHKEEIKERQKKFRDGHKNDFFACEIYQILIKNHLVHEKSEYHQKNLNNGWKDEKEKKIAEDFQPKLLGCKKLSAVWQNDLKNEKESKKNTQKQKTNTRTAEGKEEGEGQTILPCKEKEEEAFLRWENGRRKRRKVCIFEKKKKLSPTWWKWRNDYNHQKIKTKWKWIMMNK